MSNSIRHFALVMASSVAYLIHHRVLWGLERKWQMRKKQTNGKADTESTMVCSEYLSNPVYESKARHTIDCFCIPGPARRNVFCVIVACEQKGCVIVTVRNHVRSTIDHFLL